jgi:ParB/RepB/Spo0J family partition protein
MSKASTATELNMQRTMVLDVNPNRVRPFADQPREYFDPQELTNLQLSIKARGQLQPGMVKAINDREHDYEIVDGQRRWHACKNLGIPFRAIVIEPQNVEDQFEIAVAANFQRAGHTPMEIARAIERMCTTGGRNAEYVGRVMGRHPTLMNQYRRLVQLVPELQTSVNAAKGDRDRLPVMVAFEIARLPQSDQLRVYNEIQAAGLGASGAQDYLRRLLAGTVIAARKQKPADVGKVIRSFVASTIQRAELHLERIRDDVNAGQIVFSLTQNKKLSDLRGSILTSIEKLQALHDRLNVQPVSTQPTKNKSEVGPESKFVYSHPMTCPKCHSTNTRFRRLSNADPKTGTWVCMAKACELRISHVVIRVDTKHRPAN